MKRSGETRSARSVLRAAPTLERLHRLIAAGPFHVAVSRAYRLEDAARAHREIEQHHLGKLALRFH